MPRFLLVAPLTRTAAGDEAEAPTAARVRRAIANGRGMPSDRADDMRMRSRHTYTTQYLEQRWYDIVPVTSPSDDSDGGTLRTDGAGRVRSRMVGQAAPDDSPDSHPEVRIERAALAVSRSSTVIAVDAYVGDSWADAFGVQHPTAFSSIDDLERRLSTSVDHLLTDIRGDVEAATHTRAPSVAWVARYLRVPDLHTVPIGWLSGSTAVTPIRSPAEAPRIEIGWGNGVLHAVDELTDTEWDELVRGFVDSQTIWSELLGLADLSGHTLNELYGPDDRDSRRRRRQLMEQVDDFAGALATHQLAYDDLQLNIQGVRRISAMAALTSWDYEAALERVDRRLSDALAVATTMRTVNERKYQELVQTVLYGLAVLTVIDVALALISTAFSGSGNVPGEDSPLRLLDAIRLTNQDSIIVAAIVIAVAAAAAYLIGRRK